MPDSVRPTSLRNRLKVVLRRGITIEQSVSDYLEFVGQFRAPKTAKRYSAALAHFRRFCVENSITHLSQLSPSKIRQWMVWRSKSCVAPNGSPGCTNVRPIAKRTLTSERSAVSAWLSEEVKLERIPRNPASRIGTFKKGAPERPKRILSDNELRALFEASSIIELKYHRRGGVTNILRFLNGSGLRIGEAVNLIWPNVDLCVTSRVERYFRKNRCVPKRIFQTEIFRSEIHIKKTGDWIPKWGIERFVPCTDESYAALLRMYLMRVDDKGRVFRKYDTSVWTESRVRTLMIEAAESAGIEGITGPHCLRHTWATKSAEAGMSIATLQQTLGHRHLKTTQIYIHARDEKIREEVSAISMSV